MAVSSELGLCWFALVAGVGSLSPDVKEILPSGRRGGRANPVLLQQSKKKEKKLRFLPVVSTIFIASVQILEVLRLICQFSAFMNICSIVCGIHGDDGWQGLFSKRSANALSMLTLTDLSNGCRLPHWLPHDSYMLYLYSDPFPSKSISLYHKVYIYVSFPSLVNCN